MEYEIVRSVAAAQKDARAADELVRQYLPFIKAETARFLHRAPVEGQDDELSIAMFAFHVDACTGKVTKADAEPNDDGKWDATDDDRDDPDDHEPDDANEQEHDFD